MRRRTGMVTAAVLVALVAAGCGPADTGATTTGSSSPVSTTTDATSATTTGSSSPTTTESSSPTTTGSPSPTTTESSSPTTTGTTVEDREPAAIISVFFLDDRGQAIPVERSVTTRQVGAAAVEALIDGPTAGEAEAGLFTALPPDTRLLGLTVEAGTATVDLSREAEAGGGSAAMLGRLAQLVYSLTEFPTVDRVQILLEGEREETFSGEGILIDEPLTRADFLAAVPIGTPLAATAPLWGPDELPAVDPDDDRSRVVVLVAADDSLNVRSGPGVDADVFGRLAPGASVALAGDDAEVAGSTWVTVVTPGGPGWVNDFYLAPASLDVSDDEARSLVAELARAFSSGSDLAPLVSERGLWVAHHAPPIRFRRSELTGILDSSTTYRWGSNALAPDSPEIQPETFAEAVAGTFVDAYGDPDSEVVPGEVIEGPNGRLAEFAIPIEFEGFPFVTVFDPGDEPEFGGLDWISWIVSITIEDGDPVVVGLTKDEWAP